MFPGSVRKEPGMNRSELIRTLADDAGLSVDESAKIIGIFFDSMKNALLNGDRVEIRGFGSFKIKDYAGYSGRNPKTGQTVDVISKKLPFFRVGKELKDYING